MAMDFKKEAARIQEKFNQCDKLFGEKQATSADSANKLLQKVEDEIRVIADQKKRNDMAIQQREEKNKKEPEAAGYGYNEIPERQKLSKVYGGYINRLNIIKDDLIRKRDSFQKPQNNKPVENKPEKKKGIFGFFKKKLTKESADEMKLEVYESWNDGLITNEEKSFMINFINESVTDETDIA